MLVNKNMAMPSWQDAKLRFTVLTSGMQWTNTIEYKSIGAETKCLMSFKELIWHSFEKITLIFLIYIKKTVDSITY